MPFNTPSNSGSDYRICSVCGFDYNALKQPHGHKCELYQLQEAAVLAHDSGQMERYDELNRIIAAKIVGSRTSEAKRKSSRANGLAPVKPGSRPRGRPRKDAK